MRMGGCQTYGSLEHIIHIDIGWIRQSVREGKNAEVTHVRTWRLFPPAIAVTYVALSARARELGMTLMPFGVMLYLAVRIVMLHV